MDNMWVCFSFYWDYYLGSAIFSRVLWLKVVPTRLMLWWTSNSIWGNPDRTTILFRCIEHILILRPICLNNLLFHTVVGVGVVDGWIITRTPRTHTTSVRETCRWCFFHIIELVTIFTKHSNLKHCFFKSFNKEKEDNVYYEDRVLPLLYLVLFLYPRKGRRGWQL